MAARKGDDVIAVGPLTWSGSYRPASTRRPLGSAVEADAGPGQFDMPVGQCWASSAQSGRRPFAERRRVRKSTGPPVVGIDQRQIPEFRY